jgi:O-antigen/teichoic acid export membrane protein
MVKRKERLLIFIWYAASVAIAALIVQILFGGIAALIFAGVFAVFYLFFYFRYTERKIKRGKRNRNTRSSRHRRARRRGAGEDNI